MSEVFVGWQDQLVFMENNACGSGSTCYESVRSEMIDGLKAKHGRYTDLDLEEIPKFALSEFIDWLENPEEDE